MRGRRFTQLHASFYMISSSKAERKKINEPPTRKPSSRTKIVNLKTDKVKLSKSKPKQRSKVSVS